eukprot:1161665-Pelagomonas_calceolata.AAC.9
MLSRAITGTAYERRGYIAVPAYVDSLAEARNGACNQTCSIWRSRTKHKTQSQHFRHADTNLANPRTSAWFMKPLRRDALLGGAELLELSTQAQSSYGHLFHDAVGFSLEGCDWKGLEIETSPNTESRNADFNEGHCQQLLLRKGENHWQAAGENTPTSIKEEKKEKHTSSGNIPLHQLRRKHLVKEP